MKLQKLSAIAVTVLVIVGIILTVSTSGLLTTFKTVPLTGTIKTVNVDVYSDSLCMQGCVSLNVGSLSPGDTGTKTVYIKNTGAAPETLTLTVNNWNPVNANTLITVSWDRQNYVLNAGSSIQATLTLIVGANPESLSTFSCDVTIIGTQ